MRGDQLTFDFGDGRASRAPLPDATEAIITPFPLCRRRRKIVVTAFALNSRKNADARDRHWKRVVDGLVSELRRHGAGAAEIDRQLVEFRYAVAVEMAAEQRQRPGGAA